MCLLSSTSAMVRFTASVNLFIFAMRSQTPYGQAPSFLIRDDDCQYGTEFIHDAKFTGIELLRAPLRAPRENAISERFLKSVRNECPDHMPISGEG